MKTCYPCTMPSDGLKQRLSESAKDFEKGVQPALEQCLRVKIYPVEAIASSELALRFDQSGIDAFMYDEDGRARALASRMCYQERRARRPFFTFRYALWDTKERAWDCNREFYRKLNIGRAPAEFVLFPQLHVESYSPQRGSGVIGWSFAAKTKEILEFAHANLDSPRAVSIYEAKSGERRKVLEVSVEEFARHHRVIEVRASSCASLSGQ